MVLGVEKRVRASYGEMVGNENVGMFKPFMIFFCLALLVLVIAFNYILESRLSSTVNNLEQRVAGLESGDNGSLAAVEKRLATLEASSQAMQGALLRTTLTDISQKLSELRGQTLTDPQSRAQLEQIQTLVQELAGANATAKTQ